MRDDFLKRLEVLPSHDVTLLATPPGDAYRTNLTPEYLRKWGCEFTAPAGSPGARKLFDILKTVGDPIPDPRSQDFHIGILTETFSLYFNEFGDAFSDQEVFAYPKATVASLRRLARSADFRPAPNANKECLGSWREDAP